MPAWLDRRLLQQTIDEMTGILEHAAFETRAAWIRDLFDRIEVDARERRVVPVWRAATDQDVDRLDSVSSWLRR